MQSEACIQFRLLNKNLIRNLNKEKKMNNCKVIQMFENISFEPEQIEFKTYRAYCT